jgi:3-oxoacyl-[acyl-carrier protein] reductase
MRQTLNAFLGRGPQERDGTPIEAGSNAPRLDLRNRIALITGSTGQLGRVIARTLADCGADVALHYSTQNERALQLRKDIEGRGVRAVSIRGDITDASSVAQM